MEAKVLRIMILGIRQKLERGEDLETILASYVKLSDDDKDAIRSELTK